MTKSNRIIFSDEQKRVYESAMQGKNIAVLGGAGSGKSTVVREIAKKLRERGKTVGVCAPTGISAQNAEGQTVHSLFELGIGVQKNTERFTKEKLDKIPCFDVLVMDEISMCRNDVFEIALRKLKAKNHMPQIIAVGDFWQNVPFVTRDEKCAFRMQWGMEEEMKYAFRTQMWKNINFEIFVLKESQRQKGDQEFARALNAVAKGDYKAAKWIEENCSKTPFEDGIYLFAKKDRVDSRNKMELAKLPGRTYIFRAKRYIPQTKIAVPDEIELKIGARVMCRINIPNTDIVNGTMGVVVKLNEQGRWVLVRFDNGDEEYITDYEFKKIEYDNENGEKLEETLVAKQIPLEPAYALTIDKAQSLTLSKVNCDPECFRGGQLYTAMSRVRSVKDLYIMQPLEKSDVRVDGVVCEFYESIMK